MKMLIKCVKCDYSVRFGRTDGRLVLVSRFPCVLAERVRDSIYSMALRRMNPERETYLTGPVFLRTQYSIFFSQDPRCCCCSTGISNGFIFYFFVHVHSSLALCIVINSITFHDMFTDNFKHLKYEFWLLFLFRRLHL